MNFFLLLMHFKTNKRVKYAILITQIISENLKEKEENDDKKIIEDYCIKSPNILEIEPEGKYSSKI